MSLTQRIETIQMNILPRFLFLFQALPVEIKTKFSGDLSGKGKAKSKIQHAATRCNMLQLPKKEGGMAVPRLRNDFTQHRSALNKSNQEYNARGKDIEKL